MGQNLIKQVDKISKDTEDLNDRINQFDLVDVYKILSSAGFTLRIHETLNKVNH